MIDPRTLPASAFVVDASKPGAAPVPRLSLPDVVELRIVQSFLSTSSRMPFEPPLGYGVVNVHDLVTQFRDAEARGIKVAFLAIDSRGGLADAGEILYRELLAFRERGGYVVTYLHGDAISNAAYEWLSSSYVVASPMTAIWLHGASAWNADSDAAAAAMFAETTAGVRSILEAETLATSDQIEAWIGTPSRTWPPGASVAEVLASTNGVILDARDAVALGFADEVGGCARAHSVALAAVYGDPQPSTRRARLATRSPSAIRSTRTRLGRIGASVVAGILIGIGEGIIGAGCLSGGTDSAQNLVPNPGFLVWTVPHSADNSAPDAWTVGRHATGSAVVGTTSDGWTADPTLWRNGVREDASTSMSGDVSIKVTSANDTVYKGVRSVLFPVREGEVYELQYTAKTTNNQHIPVMLILYYDADRATYRGASGVGNNSATWNSLTYSPGRAPTSARWARVFAGSCWASLNTGNDLWIDDVAVRRVVPSERVYYPNLPSGDPAYANNTWARVGWRYRLQGNVDDLSGPSSTYGTYTVAAPDNQRLVTFNTQLGVTATTAGKYVQLALYKNGGAIAYSERKIHDGTNTLRVPLVVPSVQVATGDVFELNWQSDNAASTFSIAQPDSWFSFKRDY